MRDYVIEYHITLEQKYCLEKTQDGFATIGTVSGRNEYYLQDDGLTLQHKLRWITCKKECGEFIWSHGYTSRLQHVRGGG